MPFERKWDENRQAWVYDKGSARKSASDADLAVEIDEKYKRLGNERKAPAQHGESGTPVEPTENASGKQQGKLEGMIESGKIDQTGTKMGADAIKQMQKAISIKQTIKDMSVQEERESEQKQYDQDMQQRDEQTNGQSKDGDKENKGSNEAESDKNDKKEGQRQQQDSKDAQKQKPNENNIFDRWDLEVFEHFAFMVNKEYTDIHVRFAHTTYVPHMHVNINCDDIEELATFVDDFRFMRENKFRQNVIDPLLEETYKKAA